MLKILTDSPVLTSRGTLSKKHWAVCISIFFYLVKNLRFGTDFIKAFKRRKDVQAYL